MPPLPEDKKPSFDRVVHAGKPLIYWKIAQASVLALFVSVTFWQLYRTGFDWRATIDGATVWSYFLAAATLPVFGFPIAAIYIYGGVAFPPLTASAACLAGLAVNMSASFLLARTVFERPVKALLRKTRWNLPTLQEAGRFRLAFLVRTVPGPPYFIQNLFLSLVGIPFWTYLGISLATQGTIAVGMIFCSSYLADDPKSIGAVVILSVFSALALLKLAQTVRKRVLRARETAAKKA